MVSLGLAKLFGFQIFSNDRHYFQYFKGLVIKACQLIHFIRPAFLKKFQPEYRLITFFHHDL